MHCNTLHTHLTTAAAVCLLITTAACQPAPGAATAAHDSRSDHIQAARSLTTQYGHSRLARWGVDAHAAGSDCSVLLIETAVVMDDAMVSAIHYGAGNYEVYQRGVSEFQTDRAFRGVAYRDSSGQVWTYGQLTDREAGALQPCH